MPQKSLQRIPGGNNFTFNSRKRLIVAELRHQLKLRTQWQKAAVFYVLRTHYAQHAENMYATLCKNHPLTHDTGV